MHVVKIGNCQLLLQTEQTKTECSIFNSLSPVTVDEMKHIIYRDTTKITKTVVVLASLAKPAMCGNIFNIICNNSLS